MHTVTIVKAKVTMPRKQRKEEFDMTPKIIEVKASTSTVKRTTVTPVKVELDGKTQIVKEIVHAYLFAGNRKPFLIVQENNDGTGSCRVLFSR